MTTHRNRTGIARIRASLRYAWDDSLRAQRALLRQDDPYSEWIRGLKR